MQTRKIRRNHKVQSAVAVFRTKDVSGECVAKPTSNRTGVLLHVTFSALPEGKHGFHIHTAGDLRGEGCKGACAHFHKGAPTNHGDEPANSHHRSRHTGDLGNIELPSNGSFTKTYTLKNVSVQELWGRSLIVHADEDDLGLGEEEDSKTTGHSGSRIACAIFGRATEIC
jgi:Cu-Zn family superoxide dismutase